MAYSIDAELYIVTRKSDYDDTNIYKTINSKDEIRSDLRKSKCWRDKILKIQKLEFDEPNCYEVKKRDFVPERYRTKEVIKPQYSIYRIWNEIWNGDE